jgi:hypothetical protein
MNGDFFGLTTEKLGNEHISLEYLAEAGPRIVRFGKADSKVNLLAEVPDLFWETPYGKYLIRGGHRLWHSPEAFPRTYVPDNEGLEIERADGGVRLVQPVEGSTGIRKSIEIRLESDQPRVHLVHCLKNEGMWPVELAPWAITQVVLGGVAILPQPKIDQDPSALLPNRQVVMWPYSRWSDPRLELHDDYILIRGKAHIPPFKLGYANKSGWIAYLLSDFLFVKRFELLAGSSYPDFGCNTECYCNDRFLEIESLGPITLLQPGQEVLHRETWELHSLEAVEPDIDGIREAVSSLDL